MMALSQSFGQQQKQSLQQRLSPQQIQYIKLLQLPTLMLEQRIKQEIESNPILEPDEGEELEVDGAETSDTSETTDSADSDSSSEEESSVDDMNDIDWEAYFHDDADEYSPSYRRDDREDWQDLPKPYISSLVELLEHQTALLDLEESQKKLADQIIGSIDADGYLRRDLSTIIDAVAFNDGVIVSNDEAEEVLHQIQRLDPPGIAARNLRECLLIQLEVLDLNDPNRNLAIEILDKAWPQFENKHYDKILKKLNITKEQLRKAQQLILMLDPKPGDADVYLNPNHFIVPDFEVFYEESGDDAGSEQGDFVIRLNERNRSNVRISHRYKEMWDALESDRKGKSIGKSDHADDSQEARKFIREKMESARWFIENIRQRQQTLLETMKTIVALQEDFFKTGKGLRPMILKDVAERIHMDISTVSRVVNGKYVQTPFGVFELKYFFTEGLETDSGESVSNREIKNVLQEIVAGEDKSTPFSDDALAALLKSKGFPIARRTVSKYRDQLGISVARLRKEMGG